MAVSESTAKGAKFGRIPQIKCGGMQGSESRNRTGKWWQDSKKILGYLEILSKVAEHTSMFPRGRNFSKI